MRPFVALLAIAGLAGCGAHDQATTTAPQTIIVTVTASTSPKRPTTTEPAAVADISSSADEEETTTSRSTHAPRSTTSTTSTTTLRTTSTTDPMHAWLASHKPVSDRLQAAMNNAALQTGANQAAGCQQVLNVLSDLTIGLPSPDPDLNTALRGAESDLRQGNELCIRGNQRGDAAMLRTAATYITAGAIRLRTAATIINYS